MEYGGYITPEQAVKEGDSRSIEELRKLAKSKGRCEVCRAPVWRCGGCGMCFSCTTGESDASEDYELIQGGQE